MKFIKPISIATLASVLAVAAPHRIWAQDAEVAEPPAAEEAAPATEPAPEVNPQAKVNAEKAQEMMKRLSEEQRTKFVQAMTEGSRFLRDKRVQEALDRLTDAELILPDHPDVLTLKGSVFVNIRDFDRAAEYFDRMRELYPGMWQTDFNRVEMDFVRHDWKPALEGFRKILSDHSDAIDPDTLRLLDFKIVICLLKMDKAAEAKTVIEKYGFFDDSPIFYFGNAAMAFQASNDVSAAEWINNAKSIYPPQKNAIYEDSLFEAGWLLML